MLFSQLPWMSMRTDLAADFTLFMPVTTEAVSIYQTNVPAIGAGNSGTSPDTNATDATAPVVGDIESGGGSSSSNSNSGNSYSGNNRQEADQGGIEMANAPLPPTYHDPDQLLASPTVADRFRKVPLSSSSSSASNTNSGSGSGRHKRGEYARLENSVGQAEDDDEEES
jgi:hypothetical protein